MDLAGCPGGAVDDLSGDHADLAAERVPDHPPVLRVARKAGVGHGSPRGDGAVRPDHYGSRIGQNRAPYPIFTPTADSSLPAETARLVALGARVLGKYHNGWGCGWVELADPSGTMFAIASPEPADIDALLATPREVGDPFWADAEPQWSAERRVPLSYAMLDSGGVSTTAPGTGSS